MISAHWQILKQAAHYYGLSFKKADPEGILYEVSDGRRSFYLNQSATELTGRLSYIVANNKNRTTSLLRRFGFSVPPQILIERPEQARVFLEKYGVAVVKPNNSSLGNGVTVGVRTLAQLRRATAEAKKFDKEVLVEKFVVGDDYRVSVINYQYVYVVRRVPAHVDGDGLRTVAELVAEKNSTQKRYQHDIDLDDLARAIAAEQGFDFLSVPAKGARVYLRRAANIAEGGMSIDVTDELSPALKKMAIAVCRAMKLPVAGLDLICPDIHGSQATIIEVNSRPHLVLHHYPHIGRSRYPAREIMRMLFRNLPALNSNLHHKI